MCIEEYCTLYGISYNFNMPVENTISVLFHIPFFLNTSVKFPIASSIAETIPNNVIKLL